MPSSSLHPGQKLKEMFSKGRPSTFSELDFVSCISTPDAYTPHCKKKTVKLFSSNLRIHYVYYISITTFHQQKLIAHWKWTSELAWGLRTSLPSPWSPVLEAQLSSTQKLKAGWKSMNWFQDQLDLSFFMWMCVKIFDRKLCSYVQGPKYSLKSWVPTSFLECLQQFKPLHIETRVHS